MLYGSIFKIPRSQRSLSAQLEQDVAAKCLICRHPLAHTSSPERVPGPPGDHLATMYRIVLRENKRCGVRPVAKEQLVFPQHPIEPRPVVGTETGEGDQQLRAGDGVCRVKLDASNSPRNVQEPIGRGGRPWPCEKLARDGKPPGGLQ